MARHSIKLTPEEEALKASIHFKWEAMQGDYKAVITNGERVTKLVELLAKREAVPERRIKYWDHPDYQHGRLKGSHKSIFERNGTKGREIFEHVHFLPYLKYMIDGADLAAPLVDRFSDKVEDLGRVSGSDALDLAKDARNEIRKYGLAPFEACEEYYKLALDCGIAEMWANTIRENLKKMR